MNEINGVNPNTGQPYKDETVQQINENIFAGQLPDLAKATASPLELNSEYWTPVKVDEKKRVFFKELRMEQTIDPLSGESIDLLAIYFVESLDGKSRVIRQCSKRLIGVFEPFVNAGTIQAGNPFEIVYLGKKKNKNNSFMSDNWSVIPLSIG